MLNIRLERGFDHAWQWDLNHRLILDGCNSGIEVHFSSCYSEKALVTETYADGELVFANVPNIMLTKAADISVFVYIDDQVAHSALISVFERPKPEDYIYTETEVKRFEDLERRLNELEKSTLPGGGGGPAYVASDEPPADTRALWVDTAEPEEAVALGVTAEETAEGVDLYCTDELGTTKATVRHGKTGAPGDDGITPHIGDNGNWFIGDTDTGKPSRGAPGEDYELTDEDMQEIAGIAAEMVEHEEGVTLLDTSVEIPAESPVTELEWELPEEAMLYNAFYIELRASAPANSPSADIRVRLSICGNALAGSSNGNGAFRKANQTWVTATVDLTRRYVLNATFNNSPVYNISSSVTLYPHADKLPLTERNNLFRAQLFGEYAGTFDAKIIGYSRQREDSDA